MKYSRNIREALLVLYRELYRYIRKEELRTIELDEQTLKKNQITSSLNVTTRNQFVADAALLHDLDEMLRELDYNTNSALNDITDLLLSERMGYVLTENDDLNFLPFFKQREGLRQYRGHCVYQCPTLIAPRIKNAPIDTGFVVETTRYVDQNSTYYFAKQVLYSTDTKRYGIYHREIRSVKNDYRDSWTDWAKYVTDDYVRFGIEDPIQTTIIGEPGDIYFKYQTSNTDKEE